MMFIFLSFLFFSSFSHELNSSQAQVSREVLMRETIALIRWKVFWEGKDCIKKYIPGKRVEAAIIESPAHIKIFISDVGLDMGYGVSQHKITQRNIGCMPDEKNASAIEKYIADFGRTPGFRIKPGNSVDPSFPVSREEMTEKQKRRILQQDNFWFTLPVLSPPEYIKSHKSPPELMSFVATVREKVRSFYDPRWGQGKVLIPYYSAHDPTIYIYADLGDYAKGIFSFVRDKNGKWVSGNFSAAIPPNNWSFTIDRIRENCAYTMSLPE